jgi:hypothetical protein
MNIELSLKSGLSPMYITSSNMVIPIINVTTSHMASIINIIKNTDINLLVTIIVFILVISNIHKPLLVIYNI